MTAAAVPPGTQGNDVSNLSQRRERTMVCVSDDDDWWG